VASLRVPFGPAVTILFTDIRGFTSFTDRHGDEAAFRMLAEHNELLHEQIELHGGHVVKTEDDSFTVAFEAARAAITCAMAIQAHWRFEGVEMMSIPLSCHLIGEDGGGLGLQAGLTG